VADEVCDRISKGETLSQVCRSPGMPPKTTVLRWVMDDRDGLSDRYAHARELLLEHWSEEILDISDDGSNDWMERESRNGTITVVDRECTERSKLRVDTRKWLLSKLAHRKYGDKVTSEVTGKDGEPLQIVPVLNVTVSGNKS
jgi:hypothetical protein